MCVCSNGGVLLANNDGDDRDMLDASCVISSMEFFVELSVVPGCCILSWADDERLLMIFFLKSDRWLS